MSKEYIVPLSEDEAFYGYKGVAVELVRCKDCKFFQINKIDDTCIEMMCTENYDCYGAYQSTRPDDYCSGAERKDK